MPFAAVHESAYGPLRTKWSAFQFVRPRGEADISRRHDGCRPMNEGSPLPAMKLADLDRCTAHFRLAAGRRNARVGAGANSSDDLR